jgi:uncharacterized protein (DUF433 family)
VSVPGVWGRSPQIKNGGAALVLDLLASGYSPEHIRQQYGHVALEDIQACLAYAREVIHSERVADEHNEP